MGGRGWGGGAAKGSHSAGGAGSGDGGRVDVGPRAHLGGGVEEEDAGIALHPGRLLVDAAVVVVVVARVGQEVVGSGALDGRGGACLDARVVLLGPLRGRGTGHDPGLAPLVTLDEPAQRVYVSYT